MTATSLDLSQIRTDSLSSAATFRTLIGVYSEAEVDALIAAIPGGVTDHGALTGLADDDHTQYALADGSRGAFVKGSTGSTDNRILRADGTGGSTVQGSAATLDDFGNITAGAATFNAVQIGVLTGGLTNTVYTNLSELRFGVNGAPSSWSILNGNWVPNTFNDYFTIGTTSMRPNKVWVGTGGIDVAGAATFSGALNLAGITKTALLALTPNAATGGRWRVTDSSPAQREAYPDGTNWRYTSDDAIVT